MAERDRPKAEWLVGLSETYVMLKHWVHAAQAMERAAQISEKPDHTFRAARLWLAADRPDEALPLLQTLTQGPSPLGKWFVALSNCYLMLNQEKEAARAMEQAAGITRTGKHYYRAGMLWLQVGNAEKGISLLQTCVRLQPIQQQWLVSLAQALLDGGQRKAALTVMARTQLTGPDVSPAVSYQGAMLWLQLKRPEAALPVLKALCRKQHPALSWLMALVKTHVELSQVGEAEKSLKRLLDAYPEDPKAWQLTVWLSLEQADYAKAAAAMAVAVRLGPPNPDQLRKLADLYHMAGVPVKAAITLQETWQRAPGAEDWDRLTHIYLSGHRYEMALASARSAVAAHASAERWKTVGAIAFRLRRFEESLKAYRQSAAMKPDAHLLLQAGYAALKLDQIQEATRLLRKAIQSAPNNSAVARKAHAHLTYIEKIQ
ncbi:MAG: tetratricopeptide repeat protein [Deltaproteobacteria bacterium]|nr:tetratricopeptide repeat protein [Deltaproteobacteria bacterium]